MLWFVASLSPDTVINREPYCNASPPSVTVITPYVRCAYGLFRINHDYSNHLRLAAIPTQANGGNHTPAFTKSAASQQAHDAMMTVTKGLALTGFRLLEDAEFSKEVKSVIASNPRFGLISPSGKRRVRRVEIDNIYLLKLHYGLEDYLQCVLAMNGPHDDDTNSRLFIYICKETMRIKGDYDRQNQKWMYSNGPEQSKKLMCSG